MSRRAPIGETEMPSRRAPRSTRNMGPKYSPGEKVETYADIYFKENPNAVIDTDPPEVKLQKLEERLNAFDLEVTEKFQILIQQKSMIYILYGENSVESLQIHAKLGRLYNESHRPQSALRHLQKSQDMLKQFHVDQKESISIAVEIAEAHLALRSDNRQESQKHINQAMEVLAPYAKTEVDDLDLRYRRDIVNARVYSSGRRYDQALEQYKRAHDTLSETADGEGGLQMAKLYVEMAEVAEAKGDINLTREYAGNAYETFIKLGMNGSAQLIRGKVAPERVAEISSKYGDADGDDIDLGDDLNYEHM